MDQISADEVKASLDSGAGVFLLDVRTAGEFVRGKISGSVNVPVDEVPQKIESVIPNKNQTIYVYCLSGSRSVIAVEAMMNLGYKAVFNMTSGLLAWRAKGFSTV